MIFYLVSNTLEGTVNTSIAAKFVAPKQEVLPQPLPVEEKPDPRVVPAMQRQEGESPRPNENEVKMTNGKGSQLTCYPPIGPMGEMGKVARGS